MRRHAHEHRLRLCAKRRLASIARYVRVLDPAKALKRPHMTCHTAHQPDASESSYLREMGVRNALGSVKTRSTRLAPLGATGCHWVPLGANNATAAAPIEPRPASSLGRAPHPVNRGNVKYVAPRQFNSAVRPQPHHSVPVAFVERIPDHVLSSRPRTAMRRA